MWHILTGATTRRVLEACTRLGIALEAGPVPGVLVSSDDGLVRRQGWLPGRAGLGDPSTWTRPFPRTSPAGIPVPADLPDLSATWRTGRVVNFETDQQIGGVFW